MLHNFAFVSSRITESWLTKDKTKYMYIELKSVIFIEGKLFLVPIYFLFFVGYYILKTLQMGTIHLLSPKKFIFY